MSIIYDVNDFSNELDSHVREGIFKNDGHSLLLLEVHLIKNLGNLMHRSNICSDEKIESWKFHSSELMLF